MRIVVSMIALASTFAVVATASFTGAFAQGRNSPANGNGSGASVAPPTLAPIGGSDDSLGQGTAQTAHGQGLPDPKLLAKQDSEIRERLVATLASFVPAEFDAFRKAVASGDDEDAARAALRVVAKMSEMAAKPPRRQQVMYAYRTAWALCVKRFTDSKSDPARGLILAQWDRSLGGEGSDLLVQQLDALFFEFDPAFLTEGFWKLIEHAKCGAPLSRVCYVLNEHGNREDLVRVKKRLNTMAFDDPFRAPVSRLVECMEVRLSGYDPLLGPVPIFDFSPLPAVKPEPMPPIERPQLDPDWRKRGPPPGPGSPAVKAKRDSTP